MFLDKLEIDRDRWGPDKGKLKGKCRFMDGSENAIELNLTPELSEKFMAVIGEALQAHARMVNEKLIAGLVDCSAIVKKIEVV